MISQAAVLLRVKSLTLHSILAVLVMVAITQLSPATANAQSSVSENIEALLNSNLANSPPGSPGFQMLLNTALTGGPGAINPSAGSGLVINSSNGGTIEVRSSGNNSFTGNSGDGVVLTSNSGGTLTVRNFANSNFSNNGGAGLTVAVEGAGSRLSMNVTGSTIMNNGGAGIAAAANDGALTMNVGAAGVGNGNLIDGNVGAGVGVGLLRFGQGNIGIQNNTITGTLVGSGSFDGSGIVLDRRQASLLTGDVDPETGRAAAQVGNNLINGNAGSGVNIFVAGSDPNQTGQPNQGTSNGVNLENNDISGNSRDGIRAQTFASSALVMDGETNTIDANGRNGINLTTNGSSTFGDPLDANLLTARSILDGTIVTGNRLNGVLITMNDSSLVLAEFRSSASNSLFANNGRSGINVISPTNAPNANVSVADILIRGDADGSIDSGNFTTTIAGNGTNVAGLGGNGINIVANDFSAPTLTVQSTTIFGNISGAGGINGDGIQLNATGSGATPTLNVGGFNSSATQITPTTLGRLNDGISQNLGVFIDGNAGDGIEVNLRGGGASVATLNVQESVIGASQNSGNGGNGILIIGQGTNDSDQFASARMLVNVSGTQLIGNAGNGVDIRLSGAIGNQETAEENQFNFVRSNNPLLGQIGNVISANGRNGINYVSDPGDIILQRNDDGTGNLVPTSFREVQIPNAGGGNDPNPTGMIPILVNPNNPPFDSLTDFQLPFLNTDTRLNSTLVLEGNIIEFNGTNLTEGEGVFVNIGTGSRLSMDVDGNTFRGNNRADLRTQSFVSGSNPPPYVDRGGTMPDLLYLDNSAVLDITFTNNTGNTIDVSRLGLDSTGIPNGQQARYTNVDLGKNPSITPGGINEPIDRRLAAIFRANLAGGNNTFVSQGQVVDVDLQFFNGVYTINPGPNPPVPDPAFP